MRRKWTTIAATVLVIAMAAGACAKKGGQTTFTGDTSEEPEYQANLNPIAPSAYAEVEGLKLEKGTYISIIGKSEGTAFWKAVKSGVMQAAEDLNAELGYTGGDRIKVTYNAPARTEDIDEQVNILDEELSRYPDVIGIASIDEKACTVQFDLATGNGIPIIALDSGNQYSGIQCTVKTDNQEAARTGAYKLAEEINKKGDVMLLVHDSKSETAKERAKSFQDEIAEGHPDVKVAEVVYCDALDDIKKQMADEQNEGLEEGERKIEKESFSDTDAIQYVIEQHPGLKGIFATNDGTTMLGLEAIKQVEQAKKEQTAVEDDQENEKTSDEAGRKQEDSSEPDAENEAGENIVPTAAEAAEESKENLNEQSTEEKNEKNPEAADTKDDDTDGSESATEDNRSEEERSEEENEEQPEDTRIVLIGFDAGREQLKALEEGEILGLVVQNPFGIGYASVVAAARTVLQAGNEAQVSTGYLWVTKDNMNDESIQKMLYE